MTKKAGQALSRWLHANETSAHAFGLRLGEDPKKIREMIAGKRQRIDVRLAVKIEDATKGAVTCRMW